jgi:glutamate formiminotransferase
MSPSALQLAGAALLLARAALAVLDLRQHAATHPRLGTVDHISCHPLGAQAVLQSAAEAARLIGAHACTMRGLQHVLQTARKKHVAST